MQGIKYQFAVAEAIRRKLSYTERSVSLVFINWSSLRMMAVCWRASIGKESFTKKKGFRWRSDKNEIIDFFMSVGYGDIKRGSGEGRHETEHFIAIFHKCCQPNEMCFA